jgi:non-specific serine/threonine protein kinase/serine/threonine-protein kinase
MVIPLSDSLQIVYLKAPKRGLQYSNATMFPGEQPDPDVTSGIEQGRTRSMDAPSAANAVIGRYQLLQKIGEGGMGEVWLAEQKEPVRRRVALKLVKSGINTREVIARFESERQALALMDHPAIARVLDAGATPLGAPYFVMEYVAGLPITAYCDTHRLSMRERLELFIRVCEGVQHAHQKAIIHRDLKPSNILVTEVDGRAVPKIIDFGVAKALTQKLTADTMFTRVGALVGTPEYMSPEQALSSGEDIDTRTDVYSLGIILYELLAGAPPIELRKLALEEFLRRLREDEPAKPSTKIRTHDSATFTELARKRQTEPVTLAKQMRGDLDSIALKALEKDRSRRYGSPSDLAADIGRYLKNEAVLAVGPSAAYRARKFARRYRLALVTTAAFVLVLIVAAAVSLWQSLRANREAAIAQAVNDFLQNDLLAQASAENQAAQGVKVDPDLKVRTALDRAAARIGSKFGKQPEVEATIRETIGQTYLELAVYDEAEKHLTQALNLDKRILGAGNQNTLRIMNRLGTLARLQGQYGKAETILSQALQEGRNALGPEHPETLNSLQSLGTIYYLRDKPAQAEALLTQAVEIRRRVSGAENPSTLRALGNLANTYLMEAKYPKAEALYRQLLESERRVSGPEHPDTLHALDNLANVLHFEGKYGEAEQVGSEVLEIRRHIQGPEHHETILSMGNLAGTYYLQGRYAEAESLYDQTLELCRRLLGPEHPLTLAFLSDAASMYQREGKYAKAESLAVPTLAARRRLNGPDNPTTMTLALDLSQIYVSEAKFAQSESLAGEALGYFQKQIPEDWLRYRAESLSGASLSGQKRFREAEPLLVEGYRGMLARKEQIAAPDRNQLEYARTWLVQLYDAWGKPAKAAEWRTK